MGMEGGSSGSFSSPVSFPAYLGGRPPNLDWAKDPNLRSMGMKGGSSGSFSSPLSFPAYKLGRLLSPNLDRATDPNLGSMGMKGGSSGSLSSPVSFPASSELVHGRSAAPARVRKPGTWRRLPRTLTPAMELRIKVGTITPEELKRQHLKRAEDLEKMEDSGCDTEEAKIAFKEFKEKHIRWYRDLAKGWPEPVDIRRDPELSDTEEEHLTAEDMEALFAHRNPTHVKQLEHFAHLALAHYNARKTKHKFDLAQPLTSNFFSERCGPTYAHVNFIAIPQKSNDHTKRLFFAELMLIPELIPELQLQKDTEPMRVLHVSTIDDVPCFGGCHEIYRKINHKMRGVMDYERCHACHGILKHPKGDMFIGGHDSTRMPYFSAT